ncbi:MAG: SRPBCC family protein [Pseudomonadota bacterium]
MKRFLLTVVLLIAALYGLGFVLPDKVHVERTIVIDAPREAVFAEISDFKRWEAWSPWAEQDPAMITTVTGEGLGQEMVWISDVMGNGSQTITDMDAPNSMASSLEFGQMGRATALLTLEPVGAGTRVTWAFDTASRDGVPTAMQPLATYMGYGMDGMLGGDYERGLVKLKQVVESADR